MMGIIAVLAVECVGIYLLGRTFGRQRDDYFRAQMRRLDSDSDPANMMIRDLKRRLRK